MISEWELWACAQQVVKQHGVGAVDHCAKRVEELTKTGDEDGVRTWIAIADRAGQLSDYSGAGRARH